MIQVSGESSRQLSSERAMREALQSAKGGRFLSDSGAVTIAAMWQSPGPVGSQLAAFASGMAVSADDLLADIDATLPEAATNIDRTALEELRRWVEHADSEANTADARKTLREIRRQFS
jgi:glycerate-2-kinase